MSSRRTTVHVIRGAALAACVAAAALQGYPAAQEPAPPAGVPSRVMPRYDAGRNLLLPEGYREWVLVGSSLGLSYSEAPQTHRMFNTTLMEPTAYRHFVQTGEFREGTMFALILQGVGTNATPARQGQFATDVHAVEMAVKDTSRVPEGWAYYGFGGPMTGGFRATAAPQPKASCYDCHARHAARDHVFLQFYGLLNEAAPRASGTPDR